MSLESAVAAGGEACRTEPCLCPCSTERRASLSDNNVSKWAQSSATVCAARDDWGMAGVCIDGVEDLDLAERFA